MIAEDKDVVSLAWQEVGELCAGKPWRMSIPVRETDSDRVIANALTTVTERCNGLLSRVAELEVAIRNAIAHAEKHGPCGHIPQLLERVLREEVKGMNLFQVHVYRNGESVWMSQHEIVPGELGRQITEANAIARSMAQKGDKILFVEESSPLFALVRVDDEASR